jgi:PAS domain-containing protein
VERIYAYREVPGYPLLIAGLSSEQYFVPWRATAWRHWSFTALIILLVILGSIYLYLQRRREQEALRYAKRLARQQALMIENDWVGILRLHKRRITWTNRALATITGYEKKDLVGSDTRLLYPDDTSYAAIGQEGHHALRERGNFTPRSACATAMAN